MSSEAVNDEPIKFNPPGLSPIVIILLTREKMTLYRSHCPGYYYYYYYYDVYLKRVYKYCVLPSFVLYNYYNNSALYYCAFTSSRLLRRSRRTFREETK